MKEENTFTCPTCEGRGVVLIFRPENPAMPCFRCKGAKVIPMEMMAWITAGEAIRQERISRRVSLRSECEATGESIRRRSDREQGMIDPYEPEPGEGA